MQKRGQVSVFVIIGIVAIAAVIFVFLLFRGFQEKAREVTNPQEYLKSQIGDIKKVLNNCIEDKTKEALNKISLQGGHLNPIKYTNYYGNKVSFLCYKIKDNEDCYNMMFTRSEISDEIKPYLETNIKKCMNDGLNAFRDKDYKLTSGSFSFDLEFNDEVLLVNVIYPITLTKGKIIQVQDRFSKQTKTNFWKFSNLASEIVSYEARGENYDVAEESPKNLYFEIGRTGIENGNLYTLVSRLNKNEVFYFAVEK